MNKNLTLKKAIKSLFESKVKGIKQSGSSRDQFIGFCPFHPDKHRSFSYNSKGLWTCHAGCGSGDAADFAERVGIDPTPYKNGVQTNISKNHRNGHTQEITPAELTHKDKNRAKTCHNYLIAHFDELTKDIPWTKEAVKKTFTGFDVETKRFTFLHTDLDGKAINIKWHKGINGELPYSIKGHGQCRLYPMHLLKEYKPHLPLVFCEGEKDVDTLLSQVYQAVSSTTGADNIPKDLSPLIPFKNIAILYDNDSAGKSGALKLAKVLKHQSPDSKISIACWPVGLPDKWDVTDHFSQDKDEQELLDEFNEILATGKTFYDIVQTEERKVTTHSPERKTESKAATFDPAIEVEIFKQGRNLIFYNEQLKKYDSGYYKTFNDRYFLHLLTKQLKIYNSRQAKTRETLEVLKNSLSNPALQEKINSDPNILNCLNGLVDVRTMELRPHTPKHISTFQINANFDPEAECPNFEKFLSEILINDNRKHDLDLIKIVLEFIGYCCFISIPFHIALIFYGEGSNGKSVLVEVIEHLFKGHISNVHFEIIGNDSFSTSDLAGSMVNISSEIGSNAYLKDGIIKQIIAGDSIRAQRKNQPAFDFKPTAKHILTANTLPCSADKSLAFFRRFKIVPFNQCFLPQKEIDQQPDEIRKFFKIEDPQLIEKLKKERDGIFLFALEGFYRLMKNKAFSESDQVQELAKTFKIRSTSVESFISEMTEFQSGSQILFSEVFKKYIEFCNRYKIPTLTIRRFSNELRNQGFCVEKGTENKTFVKGISWKIDSYPSY